MALVAIFGVAATSFPAVADDLIEHPKTRNPERSACQHSFLGRCVTKGDLIGFEIDVASKLAADMGVEVEFMPTAWSGIIPRFWRKI